MEFKKTVEAACESIGAIIKALLDDGRFSEAKGVIDHMAAIALLKDLPVNDYFMGMTAVERQLAVHDKIGAIKQVRARTHCALKEAKDVVDAYLNTNPSASPGVRGIGGTGQGVTAYGSSADAESMPTVVYDDMPF